MPGLTSQAVKIQVQVILGDQEFDSGSLFGVYNIDKAAGSLSIPGLKTLTIYKIRARYTNSSGSVSGPWSETYYTTVLGRIENTFIVPSIDLDLENTYIVASPSPGLEKPTDFFTYEYRLYKDTGTEDFWDVDTTVANIMVVQSAGQGRFDLLKMPQPRISASGVTYRVACRTLDRNNNYSSNSALGTIVVKTIQ